MLLHAPLINVQNSGASIHISPCTAHHTLNVFDFRQIALYLRIFVAPRLQQYENSDKMENVAQMINYGQVENKFSKI